MSRSSWWVAGSLIAVVGVALVAVIVVRSGGGDDPDAATASTLAPPTSAPTSPAAAATTTVAPAPASTVPSPTTTIAEAQPADDPLCVRYAELGAATAGRVPAATPEDLEALTRAQHDFFAAAAELVAPPDQAAFAEVAAYYEATVAFYENRAWETLTLAELAETSPPSGPSGVTPTVTQVLDDRCDVQFESDRP